MKKATILIVAILAVSMVSGCFTTSGKKCGKGKCTTEKCCQKKQGIKVLPAPTDNAVKCSRPGGPKKCCAKKK